MRLKRKRTKRSIAPVVQISDWRSVAASDRAEVHYMYRDSDGIIQTRIRQWKRPVTPEAIGEWMQEYFDKVASGYVPEGFTEAPMPHCARVVVRGKVMAEWMVDRGEKSYISA